MSLEKGGAIYSKKSTITNCTFEDCYAALGGAVYNEGGTLSGLTITSSLALRGGGIYNESGSIKNTMVSDCYADAHDFGEENGGYGGGIFIEYGSTVGCVVCNNQAFRGGGIYLKNGQIAHCTIQNNLLRQESDTANIVMYTTDKAKDIYNTIGNPNAPSQEFVKASTFKGIAKNALQKIILQQADWSLAPTSTYINKGEPTTLFEPATDIAGNPRVTGQAIDRGAYEYKQKTIAKATITITFEQGTKEVKIGTGGSKGNTYTIDWGDGNPVEYDGPQYITHQLYSPQIQINGNDILVLAATGQNITALDLSGATKLSRIQVGNNKITRLDVTHNPMLTGLYAENNNINELRMRQNNALRVIDLHQNQIMGTIDCSQMKNLSKVDVANNKLTKLLLPRHEVLHTVDCGGNMLTQIDVEGCSGLDELNCWGNKISSLSLKGLTALTELFAYENQITEVNTRECTKLKTLNLSNNRLTQIDLSANILIEGIYLAHNNLTRIDLKNNSLIRYLNITHNHIQGELQTANLHNLSLLLADENEIQNVDLSQNTALAQVKLGHNKLKNIDVSHAKNLSWLKVDNNDITRLVLSANRMLYWLECDSNAIETLDLKNNVNIEWIAAQNNKLKQLDLSANTNVHGITIQHNLMEKPAIQHILGHLTDVHKVEINDNNKAWARIANISDMPGSDTADINGATQKGWNVITSASATAIEEIPTASQPIDQSGTYYDLRGQCLGQQKPQIPGIYILKTQRCDGKAITRKIIIK